MPGSSMRRRRNEPLGATSLPPELAIYPVEPDWDYNSVSAHTSRLRERGQLAAIPKRPSPPQQKHIREPRQLPPLYRQEQQLLFCSPIEPITMTGEKRSLLSRASLLLCRSQTDDGYEEASDLPVTSEMEVKVDQLRMERPDIPFPKAKDEKRPQRESNPGEPVKPQVRQQSCVRKVTAARSVPSMLDEDLDSIYSIEHQDAGCVAAPGCLGLSLYPLMRMPTPPRKRTSPPRQPHGGTHSGCNPDSPISVLWQNEESIMYQKPVDNELLELQRELQALKRWAATSPQQKRNNTYRVRFAHPIVTAVKHRPYTKPEEMDTLYFDKNELRQLEWDRSQRLPEDTVECIATERAAPKGSKQLLVSVSFPKRLSKREREANRRLKNAGGTGLKQNMFSI